MHARIRTVHDFSKQARALFADGCGLFAERIQMALGVGGGLEQDAGELMIGLDGVEFRLHHRVQAWCGSAKSCRSPALPSAATPATPGETTRRDIRRAPTNTSATPWGRDRPRRAR